MEPGANLDTRNSSLILELIRKLNKDLNQTVVMVPHEEWHRNYFDPVIVMQDGKIVPDGANAGKPGSGAAEIASGFLPGPA